MKRKYASLGTILRERRERCGLPRSFVSRQLMVGISTYTRYENGTTKVPDRHFRKISQLLGITLRDLIDYRCRDFRTDLRKSIRFS